LTNLAQTAIIRGQDVPFAVDGRTPRWRAAAGAREFRQERRERAREGAVQLLLREDWRGEQETWSLSSAGPTADSLLTLPGMRSILQKPSAGSEKPGRRQAGQVIL